MAVQEPNEQISIDVIETIADVTGTDPLTMEPPLYEVVDTDALDALFARSEAASIEFVYNGHEITIDGDGTVTVDGREGR